MPCTWGPSDRPCDTPPERGGDLCAAPTAPFPPVPFADTTRCRRVPDETPPPSKQVKPLFRHFRRIDACLQTRVAFRGSDESERRAPNPRGSRPQ